MEEAKTIEELLEVMTQGPLDCRILPDPGVNSLQDLGTGSASACMGCAFWRPSSTHCA